MNKSRASDAVCKMIRNFLRFSFYLRQQCEFLCFPSGSTFHLSQTHENDFCRLHAALEFDKGNFFSLLSLNFLTQHKTSYTYCKVCDDADEKKKTNLITNDKLKDGES